ncbi:hypothetical protein EIL87_06175 [Saccharopolyspora rhizosphaerae]|uniref:Secreted protein n=1 Tax=Saccharopolyspora rhizosphaerae TaxID=2492662 RepID=A0A3R8P2M0_9PSEU|nr:hypothetical protein [Saccharopolyspora rhizosphaerae]RRO18698.1 hypothetical protein EIL87_06175 [Saccharopolyspora rhizosphaerae]
MLNAKRVVAATVLGLPLLLAAPGMAMAAGDGSKGGHPADPSSWLQVQNQENATEQANKHESAIYQFNVGSGKPSAAVWNPQSNENTTDQEQEAEQEEERASDEGGN